MPDPTARTFPIGALLTVARGPIVSPLPEVQRLVEHLADGDVLHHQLADAADALRPALIAQHPWLTDVHLPNADGFASAEDADRWLAEQTAKYGAEHPVTPAEGGWSRDPLTDVPVSADRVLPVFLGPGQ